MDQLDFPSLSISDDQVLEKPDGEKWIEIPKNSDYWNTWNDITEIVTHEVDSYKTRRHIYLDNSSSPAKVSQEILSTIQLDGDPVAHLGVEYTDLGEAAVSAEYRRYFDQSGWVEFFGDVIQFVDVDPIAIGREIASIELACLVYETGSNAAALDYWQSDQQDSWYRQHEWADIRDVGRQTVNDRIRQTRRSLNNE